LDLYAMLVLCQQIEVNLIEGHQNVFLFILKGGQKDIFLLNIQSREICVYRDVVDNYLFLPLSDCIMITIKIN